MIETNTFGIFTPKSPKYLMIGSFPGKSINDDEGYNWFYTSKRNQFWKILQKVYSTNLETKENKQELFSKLHLGVTDIIYQCERRKGNSSDSNLKIIAYNISEITKVLLENNIEKIFFSSRFVEKEYRKVFKNLILQFPNIELITLPSPSPRYALMTLDQKVERYKEILPNLN